MNIFQFFKSLYFQNSLSVLINYYNFYSILIGHYYLLITVTIHSQVYLQDPYLSFDIKSIQNSRILPNALVSLSKNKNFVYHLKYLHQYNHSISKYLKIIVLMSILLLFKNQFFLIKNIHVSYSNSYLKFMVHNVHN